MIRRPFAFPMDGETRLLGETLIPQGPPPRSGVILVHGFRGFQDWSFFPWLARELVAHGHMVARFSFSGCGVGPEGDEFTDLEAFEANTFSREVEELHAVLGASTAGDVFPRPPKRIALVGHGRGGGVALVTAAESDRVTKLVTLSAINRFDRWRADTVEEWRSRGRLYVLDKRSGRQLPIGVALLEDFELNRGRLDLMRAAGALSAPWLILHGAEDLTVPPEDARLLARQSPVSRMILVEGAGHTYGAKHPLEEPSPGLYRVLEEVAAHLGPGD